MYIRKYLHLRAAQQAPRHRRLPPPGSHPEPQGCGAAEAVEGGPAGREGVGGRGGEGGGGGLRTGSGGHPAMMLVGPQGVSSWGALGGGRQLTQEWTAGSPRRLLPSPPRPQPLAWPPRREGRLWRSRSRARPHRQGSEVVSGAGGQRAALGALVRGALAAGSGLRGQRRPERRERPSSACRRRPGRLPRASAERTCVPAGAGRGSAAV